MRRRCFIAAILAASLGPCLPATAAPTAIAADEITALLTGNTIVGTWSGTRYHQYFEANGTTTYIAEGGRSDQGRWRANPDTNEYESWWRSTGWTPYLLVRTDDGGYAWVNGDRYEPFEVRQGKHIDW
ncbi:hypothetical protein [Roseovarius sp.]|uniref:hypothetical protein n=1 Tax=Roseovarius sp. TaxID=1486281 RepID=UPI00262F6ECA|nr:hypothetical protein [Roseovarius sp.]